MFYGLVTVDYEDHLKRIDKIQPLKNIVRSTEKIMSFFEKYTIPITFFINAPEMLVYKVYDKIAFQMIEIQIKRMIEKGHDIGMHFHPQWYFRYKHNGTWMDEMDVEQDRTEIDLKAYWNQLEDCFNYLKKLTERDIIAYRAGGYKIKPFEINFSVLSKLGIKIDSSVHDNIPPVPYSVGSGIIEIPIVKMKYRWDMSGHKKHVHAIYDIIAEFSQNNKDLYVIMMGHCKHEVYFNELDKMLNMLFDRYGRNFINFITFNQAYENLKND